MSGKSSLHLINGVERKGKDAKGPIVIKSSPDVSFRVEAIGGDYVGVKAIAGSVLYNVGRVLWRVLLGVVQNSVEVFSRLCIEVKVKIIERKDRK